jgi:hypothetical protein
VRGAGPGGDLLALLLALAIAACSTPETVAIVQQPAPAPARTTCTATPLTAIPSDLEETDRDLVPFSPTVLGSDHLFGDDQRGLRLVVGGYLDDVLEPYDELQVIRSLPLGDDRTLDHLVGTLLTPEDVWVATWSESGTGPAPCPTRALIAWGLEADEFTAVVDALVIELRGGDGAANDPTGASE